MTTLKDSRTDENNSKDLDFFDPNNNINASNKKTILLKKDFRKLQDHILSRHYEQDKHLN